MIRDGFEKVKERVFATVAKLDGLMVRKRIDADVGIYGDEKASKPVVGIRVEGEWMYKLFSAIGVLAAVSVILWLLCRMMRFLRRWF